MVLGINLGMFVAEAGAGLLAGSSALLADAADMLGDAVVYGFSLYVVGRSPAWQARAALLKGGVMVALAAGALVQAGAALLESRPPAVSIMGAAGGLALAANLACLALLRRRRDDDLNMRSAWLCSRNDVAGNVGVLAAAWGVGLTGSPWPDVLVGLALAALIGRSAGRIILDARRALVPAAR
jgi:cation diffusion facilitator family transporter